MPRWTLAGVLAALLMTGPMFAETGEETGPWTGPVVSRLRWKLSGALPVLLALR